MDSADPARNGIWRLPPGGGPELIAATPGAFLNGLTIDPATQTLYACDSSAGTIWSAPASGGTATQWLASPALAPAQSGPGHLGANGVTFHRDAVWADNTDEGTLLRIPVTSTGAPGPVQVVASGLPGADDFNFLSARSDIAFVPLNGQDEVVVVYPDGRSQVVLTAADGLASPSDTFIHGTRLYIADSGRLTPHDSKIQEARINISALLDPLTGNQ
jgi:sugar lactone lactonase YvrE